MSWSTSAHATGKAEFLAAVEALELPYDPPQAQVEQLDAAKAAVQSLVDSGAFGADGEFYASLSGHAPVNHQPGPNESPDSVYISLSVSPLAPTPEPEPPVKP